MTQYSVPDNFHHTEVFAFLKQLTPNYRPTEQAFADNNSCMLNAHQYSRLVLLCKKDFPPRLKRAAAEVAEHFTHDGNDATTGSPTTPLAWQKRGNMVALVTSSNVAEEERLNVVQ